MRRGDRERAMPRMTVPREACEPPAHVADADALLGPGEGGGAAAESVNQAMPCGKDRLAFVDRARRVLRVQQFVRSRAERFSEELMVYAQNFRVLVRVPGHTLAVILI
jgi:hypothetical protein